jgi:hypothetical protein
VGGLVSHSNYGSRPLRIQSRICASSTRPEPTLRMEPRALHLRAPEGRACRRGPFHHPDHHLAGRSTRLRRFAQASASRSGAAASNPGEENDSPQRQPEHFDLTTGQLRSIRPRRLRCCRLTLHLSPTRPLRRCPHGFKSPLSYSSSSGSAWRRVEDDAEILRNSACDVPVWCQWVSVSEPLSS